MQFGAMVEGMDIASRHLTGIARAVHLTVNNRDYTLVADPRESLLDVLRKRLGLTGAKKGVLSVKGLGRLPATGVAPAIANAVQPRHRPADPRPTDPPRDAQLRPLSR